MTTSQGQGNDSRMTARERTDLIRLATERATVLKSQAGVYAVQLEADFEDQISQLWSFDQDKIWEQAYREAQEVITTALRKARARVDEHCEALGIPEPFRPEIVGGVAWVERGENRVNERRTEPRRKAKARIEVMTKEAKQAIDARTLEVKTELLADGITSEAGKVFLAAMPTLEQLMPRLDPAEVRLLDAPKVRESWRSSYEQDRRARAHDVNLRLLPGQAEASDDDD